MSAVGGDTAVTVQVHDGGAVTDIAIVALGRLADMRLFLAGFHFFLATRHHPRFSVLSPFFRVVGDGAPRTSSLISKPRSARSR